mgnify:CR=1 FL=1
MNQTKDKSLNAYQKPVTFKNVILFTLPTIAMSLFMSFYTMVDGLFVSNFVGKTELLISLPLLFLWLLLFLPCWLPVAALLS